MYRVAKIIKSHGVRGEVKILPLTPHLGSCNIGSDFYIESADADVRPVRIQAMNVQDSISIVKIDGIDNREDADALKDRFLCVERKDLPELPPDEYYVYELTGMRVIGEQGEPLGTVSDVKAGTAQDLLEITTQNGKKYLIPAVSAFIRNIDGDNKQITVKTIPGLLDDPEI